MSDMTANQTIHTNSKPQSYRDLLVWQKGVALAKEIYTLTTHFPPDERFGLISQLRRAAVSVPSNIAEGQARNTTGEFVQSISYAEGSLAEIDTQLTLAVEFHFVTSAQIQPSIDLTNELRRMMNSLRRKLRNK